MLLKLNSAYFSTLPGTVRFIWKLSCPPISSANFRLSHYFVDIFLDRPWHPHCPDGRL